MAPELLFQPADVDDTLVVDATRPRYAAVRPTSFRLGVRVRAARTIEHLKLACALRVQAFGRRQPELARHLAEPEEADLAEGTLVLLAIRESDQQVVGTARMQTNLYAPLEYETHIELPAHYRGRTLGVGGRLAVVASAHDSAQITRLLLKALYTFCAAQQIAHVLITAQPPRDRLYRLFGYEDVYPGRLFRTASTPQYPCKLMAFDMAHGRDTLARINPEHLAFLQAHTPEIEIFTAALSGAWNRPRRPLAGLDAGRRSDGSLGLAIV